MGQEDREKGEADLGETTSQKSGICAGHCNDSIRFKKLRLETASSRWSLNLEICKYSGNEKKCCVPGVGLPEKMQDSQLNLNFR